MTGSDRFLQDPGGFEDKRCDECRINYVLPKGAALPCGHEGGEVGNPQRHCMTVEQQRELAAFINRNSLENGCDMPDFAIAAYLAACYQALCIASESHVSWDGIGGRS